MKKYNFFEQLSNDRTDEAGQRGLKELTESGELSSWSGRTVRSALPPKGCKEYVVGMVLCDWNV